MSKRKASDVFVECLEAEGVEHVFGIPGEETLDLNESLSRSSIDFIPVRHEQGGAYMADVYGRLTGRAGVCLGTLGPGALNLVTAVADAYLDRAPLVALTGQGDLERMHKESHQYIDLLRVMRPITKWNARLSDPAIIPEVVRKAFKVAETEKPGATHIELPEDVMASEIDAEPLPRRRSVPPEPAARELLRAADLIRSAVNPVALAGNGVVRTRRRARAARVRARHRHPGGRDLHGQGPAAAGQPAARSARWASRRATTGWPASTRPTWCSPSATTWWSTRPSTGTRSATRRSSASTRCPPRSTSTSCPRWSWWATSTTCSPAWARSAGTCPTGAARERLRDVVLGRFENAKDDDAFPVQPPRALWEIRQALGREDILISDVGLHKLWIGRMFPAYEPNTVLIANGLAGMGFAVPAADRGQARAPRAQRGHRERRRRLPHELPGARDRRAAEDPDRERDLGEPASTARSCGSRTRSSAATSAWTSRTRTS